MIKSVISPCCVSNLLTTVKIQPISKVNATDQDGELRGRLGARLSFNETGVDGCSGADAVALREVGSSIPRCCEVEGDGDLLGGEPLEVLYLSP